MPSEKAETIIKIMKIKNLIYTLLFLAVMPAVIWAGDYAELNFIGVSENGKYMAYEEYGMQDGSGYTYSNIYFVDIAKNEYAAPPVKAVIEEDEAEVEQARVKAGRDAAFQLGKLGIVRGNTGKLVVARLLTDADQDYDPLAEGAKSDQTINFHEFVGSMFREGYYQLKLRHVPVEGKEDHLELPVYKIELTFKDGEKSPARVLQKDDKLPKSRGLPIGYAVEYVYLYKDKIIVFLNVYTSGFEGPDMRYMAVTGDKSKK